MDMCTDMGIGTNMDMRTGMDMGTPHQTQLASTSHQLAGGNSDTAAGTRQPHQGLDGHSGA